MWRSGMCVDFIFLNLKFWYFVIIRYSLSLVFRFCLVYCKLKFSVPIQCKMTTTYSKSVLKMSFLRPYLSHWEVQDGIWLCFNTRRGLELTVNQTERENHAEPVHVPAWSWPNIKIPIFFQKIKSTHTPDHHVKDSLMCQNMFEKRGVLLVTVIVKHPVGCI